MIPKHYYLIVDTEACKSEDKKNSLVYDLGIAIVDRKGVIYEKYGLIIADIFTNRKDLMTSNYYKRKREKIINLYNQNKRFFVTFDTAKKIVNHLINKYNVTAIVGHYSRFDIHALESTNYLITQDKNNFFFPQNISIWCTCIMARQIYLKKPTYKKWCIKNNYINERNQPILSQEIIYRYISNNNDFISAHTALEDVEINIAVLTHILRQHKKINRYYKKRD